MMGVVLAEEPIARILAEAEQVLRPHRTKDGAIAFETRALLVEATRE